MNELTEADWRKEVEGLGKPVYPGRMSRFTKEQDERIMYAGSLRVLWANMTEQWGKWYPDEPPLGRDTLKRRCGKLRRKERSREQGSALDDA